MAQRFDSRGPVNPRGGPVLSGECTVPQSSRSFKGGSTGSISVARKDQSHLATHPSTTPHNRRPVSPRGRPVLSGECTVPQSSRSFKGGSTGSISVAREDQSHPATHPSTTPHNQRPVSPRGRPVSSGECTVPQSSRSLKGGSTGNTSVNKRHVSPPKYPSKTAKRMAKLARRALRDSAVVPHFIKISPSNEIISPKPIETLPHIGEKNRNLSIPTSCTERCMRLASVRAQIKKKSGGTYARDRDISEEDSIADSALWKKLDGHNDFIANRIRSLSLSAWQQNHKVSTDYAIPNWSQEEWVEFKKENNFAETEQQVNPDLRLPKKEDLGFILHAMQY
ncbi:hypothetical protein PCASD_19625 [Puccinia coronata f. sp. avenae]|uniref:Uncharacterized protein n=1 Tax=Puccinia coronata f. sp. avenae TaxID=200324 RepID=A0A2N5TTV7_9BASI|nr:hypothetical protein PCASD_19625 [Puccinia coronata f. sp. avenae]